MFLMFFDALFHDNINNLIGTKALHDASVLSFQMITELKLLSDPDNSEEYSWKPF